jgi:hypothetical protein
VCALSSLPGITSSHTTHHAHSPSYMALEVLTGEGYDSAVDFWSLGVILYELLVGCTPFEGDRYVVRFRSRSLCVMVCEVTSTRCGTVPRRSLATFTTGRTISLGRRTTTIAGMRGGTWCACCVCVGVYSDGVRAFAVCQTWRGISSRRSCAIASTAWHLWYACRVLCVCITAMIACQYIILRVIGRASQASLLRLGRLCASARECGAVHTAARERVSSNLRARDGLPSLAGSIRRTLSSTASSRRTSAR